MKRKCTHIINRVLSMMLVLSLLMQGVVPVAAQQPGDKEKVQIEEQSDGGITDSENQQDAEADKEIVTDEDKQSSIAGGEEPVKQTESSKEADPSKEMQSSDILGQDKMEDPADTNGNTDASVSAESMEVGSDKEISDDLAESSFDIILGQAAADAVPQKEVKTPGTVVVKTAKELPQEIPAGMIVELANDITLSERQQINNLAGVLDGKGFTITLADKTLVQEASGTIQNLNITGNLSPKGDYQGTMVTFLNGGTIRKCSSRVDIAMGLLGADGGIVGKSNNGKVYNSFYFGKVSGTMAECGGIIGQSNQPSSPSEIKNCYYTGTKAAPVNFGNCYNENDPSCMRKTEEEMKDAGMAALLNEGAVDTGFQWTASAGNLPILTAGSAVDPAPDPEKTDFTALSAKAAEVRAMEKTDFTAETWAVVEEALKKADQVLADPASSQAAVDGTLKELTDAVKALKRELPRKAVKLPAEDQIVKVTTLADIEKIGTGEGKYYRLENDITIKSNDWYFPMDEFQGVFDGNGHTITFDGTVSGLFKTLGEKGVIQNTQFAGHLSGGAPTADAVYGAVINCISTVSGKESIGLVKRLANGVISNCAVYGKAEKGSLLIDYGKDNYESVEGSKYVGKIYNTYWIKGSSDPDIPQSDLLDGAAGKAEEDMKVKDIVNALNAGKGENGIAWGQNGTTGFPYFGADQDYDPDRIDLPDSKYVVKFGDTPESAVVIENKRLDVSLNDLKAGANSIIGQFFIEGVESSDITWSVYDVKNKAVDINKQTGQPANGKLHIFAEGEGVVKAQVRGEDAVWVKVFVTSKQIEDFKLFIKNKDVTNSSYTVQGSEWADIKIKAKYQGESEYKNVFSGVFDFTYADSMMVHNSGSASFHFNQPGTSSVKVQARGTDIVKNIDLISEFVPIETIQPDLSEMNYLHARASMADGRQFDAIETNGVIILPENASNKKGFNVTSSNPEVAEFTPTLPLGYLPFKAGTTVLTASIKDTNPLTGESREVTGTRTVEFKYKNPLTKVTVNEKNVEIKAGTTAVLDLGFEGSLSKDGWSVSEPELIWTFEGDGGVSIGRDPLHEQHRNEEGGKTYPEGEAGYWIASTKYVAEGLSEGTVIATGTPVDQTNNAEPVKINITVTPGDIVAIDIPALVKTGKETAMSAIRKKNADGYTYSDEWDIYAILRAGESLTQEEQDGYYNSVVDTVKTWKKSQKPTDIERVMLALAVMGKDPSDVGGVDLVDMLCSSSKLQSGSNELTYALIALDAANVETPAGAKWSRESILAELLKFQNEDGGIALFPNGSSGPDTTAMTLQALAPYKDRPEAAEAIEKGLQYLKAHLTDKKDAGNSEATAQVLLALTTLKIDPLTEKGFFDARNNLITGIMRYHLPGEGFLHVLNQKKPTDMSAVQVYHALDSYDRFVNDQSTYWDVNNRFHKPDVSPEQAAAKVKEQIDNLPENITLKDEENVKAARKAFNELTTDQKKLVTNIDLLTAAENKIAELKKPETDAKAAKAVEDKINSLPENITLEDKNSIQEARKAYDALTDDQKKLVADLDKLIRAEQALKDLEKDPDKGTVTLSVERFTIGQGYFVEPVIVEFQKGETVADILGRVLGDKAMIRDKGNYLEAVKDGDQGVDFVTVPEYITQISKNTVTTESTKEYYREAGCDIFDPGVLGEFTYSPQAGWMYHANGIESSLGIGQYELQDNDVIRVQYTLYGLGTDLTGKEYGTGNVLVDIQNKDEITRLMAQVNAAPGVVKKDPAVEAAYAAAVKAVKDVITPKKDLDRAYNDLKTALEASLENNKEQAEKDQKAADEVSKMIRELNEDITLQDKAAVQAAREAYDKLTEDQKKLVVNFDKLVSAEKLLAELEKPVTPEPEDPSRPTVPHAVEKLTDAASNVEIRGEGLTSDMELIVTLLGKNDTDVKLMRNEIPSTEGLIRIYNIKLMKNGTEVELPGKTEITLPVSKDFNGKELKVLFNNNGNIEMKKGTVKDGCISLTTDKLGSFGIVVDVKDIKDGEDKAPSAGGNPGAKPGSGNAVVNGTGNNVKTADESPIGILIVMGILSLAAAAGIYKRRRFWS